MRGKVRSYDLVVIGGGPAGIVGAALAISLGKSVALVDSHRELGGAGINTGTVPSKTLRETALALSNVRSRNLHGVDLSLHRQATVGEFLGHERNVKASLNAMVSHHLGTHKADVYAGTAELVDGHQVRVRPLPGQSLDGESGELMLRGKYILIATGSSPIRPSIFPFDLPGVYDSDTILSLDRVPATLAVVGAGVIGSEYASTFAALGTKVHVIDGRDVLLPFLDGELSRGLAAAMMRNGIQFHWGQRVVRCAAG